MTKCNKISDEDIVAALLSCSTLCEAAEQLGVHRATLWRRLGDHQLRQKLRETKERMHMHTIARIQDAATEAVDTMRTVMLSAQNDATRLAAARALLSAAIDCHEVDNIQRRIELLEQALVK